MDNTNACDYILAYIPFYSNIHRRNWINNKLDKLKLKYNNNNNIIINGEKFGLDVINYYLLMAYSEIFYGSNNYNNELRLDPLELINLVE